MQKRRAHLGPVAALVIGLVATVVVGAIGVAVSIRVSYNQSAVEVDCAFNNNNSSKEITVNADKGDLYYALESCVNKNDTSFKVSWKDSKNGSYTCAFNGYLDYQEMVGYNYACYASGWSKRYFKVQQTNHLSSSTTHASFYAEVR
jgi:hypothetical protein